MKKLLAAGSLAAALSSPAAFADARLSYTVDGGLVRVMIDESVESYKIESSGECGLKIEESGASVAIRHPIDCDAGFKDGSITLRLSPSHNHALSLTAGRITVQDPEAVLAKFGHVSARAQIGDVTSTLLQVRRVFVVGATGAADSGATRRHLDLTVNAGSIDF